MVDEIEVHPVTLWITVYAWLCCSAVWLLSNVYDRWWMLIPAIFLISSSFAVAVGKDLKDMKV